jgi:myo-inositol-1(or 4)-monophosphatase
MLLPYYGKVEFKSKQSDKRFELVTKLDSEVELFLKTEFSKRFPDISFTGEETGGDHKAEKFWLVDPIDGTAHFIRGIPFCTTMVALIDSNEVVFSAIYDFVNDVMYSAEKGQGALANEKPIHVSNRPLEGAYMAYETHLDKEENFRWFLKLREKCIPISIGCSGFEFHLIASGRLEGRICIDPHGKDYDFAAGTFLVREAGGIVANIGQKTYDYKNLEFLAVNPNVFNELTTGTDAIFPIL